MNTQEIKKALLNKEYDKKLLDVYLDEGLIDYQRKRYVKAIESFEHLYGEGEVIVLSVPGRSEVAGNHTDHQHGQVLACSINMDIIGIARKSDLIDITSDKRKIKINVNDLKVNQQETGHAESLVRGVVARLNNLGYSTGGFKAYFTSDVLIGSGMSSSAAFEVMIGNVISYLYNDGKIDAVEIAKVSQYAENVYFGKPCGLMDQMACSVGGLINIDFKDNEKPVIKKVDTNFDSYNYSLCLVNTKGSHANLTNEYAAIPSEMKKVANCLGKDYISECQYEDIIANIDKIRKKSGDRAVVRSIHILLENQKVQQDVKYLENNQFDLFLQNVKESGNSSYKYLQNVYAVSDFDNQAVSIGICTSEIILKDNGVVRVHGGGFAGTIQAFVKNEFVNTYKSEIEKVFGEGSCNILKVRNYGGLIMF